MSKGLGISESLYHMGRDLGFAFIVAVHHPHRVQQHVRAESGTKIVKCLSDPEAIRAAATMLGLDEAGRQAIPRQTQEQAFFKGFGEPEASTITMADLPGSIKPPMGDDELSVLTQSTTAEFLSHVKPRILYSQILKGIDTTNMSVVPENTRSNDLTDDSDPTHKWTVLLNYVYDNPNTPVSAIYDALGIGRGSGTNLKDRLRDAGLLREIKAVVGRGAPKVFLELTALGLKFIGKSAAPPPAETSILPGKGGDQHRKVQVAIQRHYAELGMVATVEASIDGKCVDVLVVNPVTKDITVVEVQVHDRLELLADQVKKNSHVIKTAVQVLVLPPGLIEKARGYLQAHLAADTFGNLRFHSILEFVPEEDTPDNR